jgi:hypothetical protein
LGTPTPGRKPRTLQLHARRKSQGAQRGEKENKRDYATFSLDRIQISGNEVPFFITSLTEEYQGVDFSNEHCRRTIAVDLRTEETGIDNAFT